MPEAVRVTQLGHHYGNNAVFQSVSLTLDQGQCMAILGPSGCGKTTLIRAIAGLITPTTGQIQIHGETVVKDGKSHIDPAKRGVSMVFQDYALFPNMTVAQNIAFGIQDQPNATERVEGLLQLAEIDSLADRFPSQLSGGQQQRVALLRALAPRPKILLLDEPFANVDSHLKQQLGNALRRILAHEGASAIFITHDQSDALSLSDRVAVMTASPAGTTVGQLDTPESVYLHPATPAVAALTGGTQLRTVEAVDSKVTLFGQTIALAQPMSGLITLLIRPEQLEFIEDEHGSIEVVSISFQGPQRLLNCMYQSEQLVVHHHCRIKEGARGYFKARMPLFGWPEKHSATTTKG